LADTSRHGGPQRGAIGALLAVVLLIVVVAAAGGRPVGAQESMPLRLPPLPAPRSPEPAGLLADEAGLLGGTTTPPLDDVSSVFRNRVEESVAPGEAPEFAYPRLHEPVAEYYRDRHGAVLPEGEEPQPFVFPSLVNLLFEHRFLLAEADPGEATRNQLRRRLRVDIRDPGPDTANFPNSAYTIPKGRLYIENSPVGFYGRSRNGLQPRVYQWEYLLRYGLTDHVELRLFSNGVTHQGANGPKQPAVTGYSPLAFDFKVNVWEENTRYWLPAMGLEVYLQTDLGSAAFDSGTQPSLNLLFDQTLPWDINFEYNFGLTGVQNAQDQITYQFSYQFALQRQVVPDFDVFFQGFYNAAALPRLLRFQSAGPDLDIPRVTVLGGGAIWTVSDRVSVFGSYNFGVTDAAPRTIGLLGFAIAL
jgi:hypothetical protein